VNNLNNDKEKILISISMGGMVGSKWCHLFPNDFNYFVIMNSSFKNLSPVHKRVQPSAMKEFVKIFATKDHTKREEKIISLCSNRKSKHPETLITWVKLATEKAMSQENMVRQTIAAARFSMDFKLQNKVLIIVALHDKLAHFTCSQQIRDFWQADYEEIDSPDVGHAIHIDASSQAPEIIHNWYLKQSV
jgi:pimeloyl-[acyl-carrier protein] methyl ester esterase